MHGTLPTVDEIEEDIKQNAPSTIYKFRSWSDLYHQRLLTHRQIWFAHPFTLNDPLDVRPDIAINLAEVQSPAFFAKLLASVNFKHPWLNNDRDRNVVAENHWQHLKLHPDEVLANRREYLATEKNFDPYGIFSTGINPLSQKLWREYADNYNGYCIGFNTLALWRQLNCHYGPVYYSDTPLPYSFLNQTFEENKKALFTKKTIWQEEEEFRFLTAGIGGHSKRLHIFTADTVWKFFLGGNLSPQNEAEIMDLIINDYPANIPIFKVSVLPSGVLQQQQIR